MYEGPDPLFSRVLTFQMILVLMPGMQTFLKLVLVCFFTVVLVDSILISCYSFLVDRVFYLRYIF